MTWGPLGPLYLLHARGPRVGSSWAWVRPLWGRGAQRCTLFMPRFSLAEIIFLRAITPAYPANHADIIFDITDGNLRDSFDIIKRYMDGMTVGECPETSGAPRRPLVLQPVAQPRPVADQPGSHPGPWVLQGPAGNPHLSITILGASREVEPPALSGFPAAAVCCLAAK